MTRDGPIDRRRRALVLAAGAAGLAACTSRPARDAPSVAGSTDPVAVPTIDMHCHAGTVLPSRTTASDRPFSSVAAPMRAGGMDVVCLAVVSDTSVTRADGGPIRAYREPAPGELYDWALKAHVRAQALIAREGLEAILDGPGLRRAVGRRRGVILASEGADFLEGRVDRVDEFHERHGLRHLQLTHDRVNELGDIQTAPRVHGGLTDVGRAVVRRCNERGLVVDVAHAPYEMVRDVVDAATKPIVLSHTSLSPALRPSPYTRLISSDHARLVASTGGVVGVWPPAVFFPTLAAMATGIARMADVAGIDHVGLGTDLLGLTGPSVFDGYARLPALREALRETGFDATDTAKILGGNYARVFAASTTSPAAA